MYEASRYNSITGTYANKESVFVCVWVNVVQSVHGSIGKLTFLHYITISNFGELFESMCSILPNIPFFFPCRISIHCCRWDGFDLNSSIFDLIPSIFTRSDHTEWLNWMLILQSPATIFKFFSVWIPVRPTGIQLCHVLLEQQAHRTHSPNKSFNLLTHISDDLAKFVANRNLYESYRWHSRLISGWFEMMKRSVKSPAENQIHLIYISNHSRTNKNWRRTKKNRYE